MCVLPVLDHGSASLPNITSIGYYFMSMYYNLVVINLGPQHPSTHGVLSLCYSIEFIMLLLMALVINVMIYDLGCSCIEVESGVLVAFWISENFSIKFINYYSYKYLLMLSYSIVFIDYYIVLLVYSIKYLLSSFVISYYSILLLISSFSYKLLSILFSVFSVYYWNSYLLLLISSFVISYYSILLLSINLVSFIINLSYIIGCSFIYGIMYMNSYIVLLSIINLSYKYLISFIVFSSFNSISCYYPFYDILLWFSSFINYWISSINYCSYKYLWIKLIYLDWLMFLYCYYFGLWMFIEYFSINCYKLLIMYLEWYLLLISMNDYWLSLSVTFSYSLFSLISLVLILLFMNNGLMFKYNYWFISVIVYSFISNYCLMFMNSYYWILLFGIINLVLILLSFSNWLFSFINMNLFMFMFYSLINCIDYDSLFSIIIIKFISVIIYSFIINYWLVFYYYCIVYFSVMCLYLWLMFIIMYLYLVWFIEWYLWLSVTFSYSIYKLLILLSYCFWISIGLMLLFSIKLYIFINSYLVIGILILSSYYLSSSIGYLDLCFYYSFNSYVLIFGYSVIISITGLWLMLLILGILLLFNVWLFSYISLFSYMYIYYYSLVYSIIIGYSIINSILFSMISFNSSSSNSCIDIYSLIIGINSLLLYCYMFSFSISINSLIGISSYIIVFSY